MRRHGDSRVREVIGEKTALEDLIKSLRTHLSRLTTEVEQNKAVVHQLRTMQSRPASSPVHANTSVRDELVGLRREVERLGTEVHRLGGIVEEGLDARKRARGERTIRMEEEEAARLANIRDQDLDRVRADMDRRQARAKAPPTPGPSKLRQGLHAAANNAPIMMPPTDRPPTRTLPSKMPQGPDPRRATVASASEDGESSSTSDSRASQTRRPSRRSKGGYRVDGPSSPFPSIRIEDEQEFLASLGRDEERLVSPVNPDANAGSSAWARNERVSGKRHDFGQGDVPPQTVLARVIGELEEEFVHYKAWV